jgi:shikimate dehydrogenase
MITGKTKTVGIIGWPIGHSLSPLMQNQAFETLNLDFVYIPLPVPPNQLEAAVNGLKSMGFAGANVTIPHKVTIMKYLDEIDETAERIGAVNTLVLRDGKTVGYNTDAAGFIRSLADRQVFVDGKKAIVLGAGGAARAVVCGLSAHGIASVTVATRDLEKATQFTQLFKNEVPMTACHWQQTNFLGHLQQCDLLINCTPIGMSHDSGKAIPVTWNELPAHVVVCDLVYNPPVTHFLKSAAEYGYKTINGEGMLAAQGALAFELWTGTAPSHEIFYQSIHRQLNSL